MSSTNGKLNAEQRKALVKIVQNSYNRRIEKQHQVCDDKVARITTEVKQELGVTDIEEQITCHESMVKELEAEKEKLGFSKYSNGNVLPGSEARKLIDKRARDERSKVHELQQEMDRIVSSIWTATELAEVKMRVEEVLDTLEEDGIGRTDI